MAHNSNTPQQQPRPAEGVKAKEQAREWREYYENHPELTAPQVADHFRINVNTMYAAWRRYGMRGQARDASSVQPFAAATKAIRRAVYGALVNEDQLSQAEYDVLQSVLDLVGDRQS